MGKVSRKYLVISTALVLALCAAQISGSTILILSCLGAFMILICVGCIHNFTLPLLLFFLAWSPLLKINAGSNSFYTIGLALVCIISAMKKNFRFQLYHITIGMFLLALTLFAKMLNGSQLSLDYICFMMLIVLFPVIREENTAKAYNFSETAVFFAAGIIIAALCAQQFASYHNIAKYINVQSYLTIVRRCGFYGDPNFYTAQITAALGGCLLMILKERSKGQITLMGALILLLLYCGFLSGSKSFVLVTGAMVFLWGIAIVKMHRRAGLKVVLIIFGVSAAVYIATSSLFGDLIEVLITRFSFTSDMSSFTTGRTELWMSYFEELANDMRALFIGKGFTNVKVNGRGSHNTIIQIIFQFGLVGTPFLASWILSYFKSGLSHIRQRRKPWIHIWIILIGAFLPWMAIDMLFFDEFFLMQWYTVMAIQEECKV